jgi:dUTP pyrophosphatase
MFTKVSGVTMSPDQLKPRRQSDGAIGYDLRILRVLDKNKKDRSPSGETFPVTLEPGEVKLFGTGIVTAIPEGHDGQVRPRSGLSAKEITLANGIGTIDPDYRGEVGLLFRNDGKKPYIFNEGDRVAQLVITKVELPEFQYVDDLSRLPMTRRGADGFGSTGTAGDGPGTTVSDSVINKRDRYFMKIVLETANRSDCVRGCYTDNDGRALRDLDGDLIGQERKLGCVFAIDDQVIASGYNCNFPGADLCAEHGCLRMKLGISSGQELEKCHAVHAEQLAVIHAANRGIQLAGSTMYVNAEPCLWCARIVAALDIEALVILDGGYSSDEGLEIVRRSRTQIRRMTLNDLR